MAATVRSRSESESEWEGQGKSEGSREGLGLFNHATRVLVRWRARAAQRNHAAAKCCGRSAMTSFRRSKN